MIFVILYSTVICLVYCLLHVSDDGLFFALSEAARVLAKLRLIESDHVLFGYAIAVSESSSWSLHRFVGMLERNRSPRRTASPLSHAALQHS